MKKTTLFLATILAVVSLLFSGCVNVDKQLQETVAKLNAAEYPRQIDAETILDSLSVSPGKNLYYHYTLLTLKQEDFTPEMIESMKFNIKVNTIQIVRMDKKEIKPFRKAKVTFHHEYKDMDGNVVVEIIVTPEDYNYD